MKSSYLVASFIRIGGLWGMAIGIVVGLFFGITFGITLPWIALQCISTFAMHGAVIGATAGGANGGLLALLTLLIRRQAISTRNYRILMTGAGSVIPFVLTGMGMLHVLGFTTPGLIVAIVVALGIGEAGFFIAYRLSGWYIEQEYDKPKRGQLKAKREGYGDPHPSLSDDLDEQEHQQRDINADEDVRDHQHRTR